MQGVAKQAGTEYVKGFAKEGGKTTADYVAENGDEHISDTQRQLDDAKAQAQVGGVHVVLSRSAQIEVDTLGFLFIIIRPVGKILWLLLRSLNRRQNFLGFLKWCFLAGLQGIGRLGCAPIGLGRNMGGEGHWGFRSTHKCMIRSV